MLDCPEVNTLDQQNTYIFLSDHFTNLKTMLLIEQLIQALGVKICISNIFVFRWVFEVKLIYIVVL